MKIQPNLEAERSLLGVLTFNPALIAPLLDLLPEPSLPISRPLFGKDPIPLFSDYRNQLVFDALVKMQLAGDEIDSTTLMCWLQQRGLLETVGGPGYLAQMEDEMFAITESYMLTLARLVMDCWASRVMAALIETRPTGAMLREITEKIRPRGESQRRIISNTELAAMQFAPLEFLVNEIIPQGAVCLLAGKPKLGKSWLALGLSLAVAQGGIAMMEPKYKARKGEFLYLALEDTPRRIRDRQQKVQGGASLPAGGYFAHEWEPIMRGGGRGLDQWLEAHPEARLVVIDTLQKVRTQSTAKSANLYADDYADIAPISALAMKHGVTFLLVHHLRKSAAEDPLDAVSGSSGLTGAVDAVLVLDRGRGENEATLKIIGRDLVQDHELALLWDAEYCSWGVLGTAKDRRMEQWRDLLLEYMREEPRPASVKVLAALLGEKETRAREVLRDFVRSGFLSRTTGGRYALCGVHYGNA